MTPTGRYKPEWPFGYQMGPAELNARPARAQFDFVGVDYAAVEERIAAWHAAIETKQQENPE